MASSVAHLRVGIVDDDPLMRDLLRRALQQLDIDEIRTAEDGSAALRLLEAAPVDILFCDLNMPGMDGIELMRHLGELADPPPIAMVSTDDQILRVSTELGGAHRLRVLGTIVKPVTPARLLAVLEQVEGLAPAETRGSAPVAALSADEILRMIPEALELVYQPQVDLRSGRPVGAEALARLRHGDALLSPAVFLPVVEDRGMSFQLLRAVTHQALQQVAAWRASGLVAAVSINASAEDLNDTTLVGRLATAADGYGVPLDAVTIELTETKILPDDPGPIEVLSRMRMRGVGVAIDDYGTGFSSLQQLRRVPFNELKIDQAFIMSATTDEHTRTMVASTIELAHKLGLTTVAEGVETAGHLELVQELGCDRAQGYHLARPMPAAEATTWLEQHLT